MRLITKIDEAGTHGSSPHMIMAGYTAQPNQWRIFDDKWRKTTRKVGIDYFHAKEMWRSPFTEKLVDIADRTLMFGFIAKLKLEDYKRFYREHEGWGGKVQPDSMYGLCFRYCLSFVLQQALYERPEKDLTLDFIIESGHKNEGAPAVIVEQLKGKQINGVSEYLGGVVAGDKKAVLGLQAADALAFGAWHAEINNNVPILSVPPKTTITELAQSHARVPLFRCDIDERELRIFRDGYFAHIEHRRQFARKNGITKALKLRKGSDSGL